MRQALEAAVARLRAEAAGAATTDDIDRTAGQHRADALGLIAEAALAQGLDAGHASDRYQVVLHVDAPGIGVAKAATVPDEMGQAVLEETGTRVSAETSMRLACDAALVVMHHGADGAVLDVGRKTRTIPPAIRRALTARDGRCRFPGCTARICDAHHIQHWAHGGATELANLVLLCRRHHRSVHEEGWMIERDDAGEVVVHRPDGQRLPLVPAPPWTHRLGDPLGSSEATLRKDIVIGPHTTTPNCHGEHLDIGWAVDVLRDSSACGAR